MPQDIISSTKRYRLRPCPYCGGSLYLDEEEKEWHCINCDRQPERVSVNNNRVSTTETPISTTETPLMSVETPAISKRRRPSMPAQGSEKIYSGHTIEGVWWPPREITFRRRHIVFLIKNLPQLREGTWPANLVGSGYIDLPMARKGKGRTHRAYFETPIEYAAEITVRMEKAGIDGLILLAIECWEESPASLANYLRMPEWSILKRRGRALGFVAGWRRKESYKEFLR